MVVGGDHPVTRPLQVLAGAIWLNGAPGGQIQTAGEPGAVSLAVGGGGSAGST